MGIINVFGKGKGTYKGSKKRGYSSYTELMDRRKKENAAFKSSYPKTFKAHMSLMNDNILAYVDKKNKLVTIKQDITEEDAQLIYNELHGTGYKIEFDVEKL